MFKFSNIGFYFIFSCCGFFAHNVKSSDVLCESVKVCSQPGTKNSGGITKETAGDNMNLNNNFSHVLDLSEQPATREEITKVSRDLNVVELYLQNSNIDNEKLKVISSMSLTILDIANNIFDDDGISSLSAMKSLENLDITHNKVTDKGIKFLEKLHNLKNLKANYTYLANEGIKILSHFAHLEHLAVRACGFDDNALSYFLMIPNLKTLDIIGNKNLTRVGVANFLSKKEAFLNVKHDTI